MEILYSPIIIRKLTHNKVIVLGTVIQVIVYAIEIPTPPFPVWVFAFGLYGVGTALQVLFYFLCSNILNPYVFAILLLLARLHKSMLLLPE